MGDNEYQDAVGGAAEDGTSNPIDGEGYNVDDNGAAAYTSLVDPSPYLCVATLIFCIAINIFLCCFVKVGESRRQARKEIDSEHNDTHQEENPSPRIDETRSHEDASSTTSEESQIDEDGVEIGITQPDRRSKLLVSPTSSSAETMGFEAVLRSQRSRRRGHARLKHAVQKMEIIYQAAEDDEPDNFSESSGDDSLCELGPAVGVALKNSHQIAIPTASTPETARDLEYTTLGLFLERAISVTKWDVDMRRIFKLGIPFVLQACIEGGINVLTMAVVGNLIGTRELSAFVIVGLLVEMTEDIVGGIHESLATLCPHAMSTNKKLVGEYIQLSIVFCVLLTIPLSVFWYFFIDEALEWMGFDEETVTIGHNYAMILIIDLGFMGIGESIHALLDTIGLEGYSTVLVVAEDVTGFLLILLLALLDHLDLQIVGLVHLLCHVLFMVINIAIILRKGWFDPYIDGIYGTSAIRNTKAIALLLRTGFTLSFGYILTEGEWEILTIFAAFLGPSAVAAWGILGTLWDAFETVTEALGDAAEVRCAFLLGADEPHRAMMTAYKAIFVGMIFAGVASTFIFVAGDRIPGWLTRDPVLQYIMRGIMPLFALGNMALTMGQLCWTVLGSQGRYRLATLTAFFGTCFFTIPVSAVFGMLLNFNLQGQTAAIVVGYMLSGTINAYYIFTSDWHFLSRAVMEGNAINEHEQ